MRVALAQFFPVPGNIEHNTKRILTILSECKGSADIVVFPELSITGYCIGDLVEDHSFLQENRAAMETLAKATDGITAVVGFIDTNPQLKNDDGSIRRYNAAAVLSNGTCAGIVHKALLPNYRYFDEKRFFSPGNSASPITVKTPSGLVRLGVCICEDAWDTWYSFKPIPELISKGAEIILHLNASPYVSGKVEMRERLIRRHVRAAECPYVFVNTVGIGDNGKNILPFDGNSMAANSRGDIIARLPALSEAVEIVDFNGGRKAIPEAILTQASRDRELFNVLTYSIKEYMRVNRFTKIIQPLSGGIDSALGLALAVRAVGAEHVVAYNLPSQFNSVETQTYAEKIAHNLGVSYRKIPIEGIVNEIKTTFADNAHPVASSVAYENLQSRIRGVLMMLESNDTGALLLSNGNKTEIALGYSTLYGDMCGGISPLGDLSKSVVYRLSHTANELFGREVIPRDVFTLPPSAELASGQVDPFDYDVVSPLVDELIAHRISAKELLSQFQSRTLPEPCVTPDAEGKTVYDKHTNESFVEILRHLTKLLRRSVYKRLQGPPIIAITDRAFGFDLRETICNGWVEI